MKQQCIWMTVLAAVFCGCHSADPTSPSSQPETMSPQQVKEVMAKVADWQLANPSQHDTTDWTYGALFAGLTAWAQMADSEKYYDALIEFGNGNEWKVGAHLNPYHADDHAVGQMYLELYKKYQDPQMIADTQTRFDWILANLPSTPLTHDKGEHKKRWNWCDALFMAPPVWAKLARVTGETKYLDYMNRQWWATTDYLYDPQEHLYFRDDRYFNKREANGEKIFWSRGNGWVFGGIVRVLEELPECHPDRSRYVMLYKEMAEKIKAIQPKEGLWHSSLLDPVNFPSVEASGSGFYCYGLAWGINHGLLDEADYLPAVMKSWQGLVNCAHPDGKLGYVQPIGADPRHVNADQTEIYGVGSFLLAGSEVYKIALRNRAPVQKVIVTNPAKIFRGVETVSLDWNMLKKQVPGLSAKNAAVLEFKTNQLLMTQIIEDENQSELLFQTSFAPGEKKYFWVIAQPAAIAKPTSTVRTHCRYVPERVDDFAWENDRVAFRVYGPGLWDDAVNSGVDCWLKRVDYPIIDKWYGNMEQKTYHKDWGEGYDPYHVGASFGCGGLRIAEGDKLIHSNVYDGWNVVANGPIRSIFELTYDTSWKESGMNLVETKRISIDLGQQLCRFESTFMGLDAASIQEFAIGVTTHDQKAKSGADDFRGIVTCWETIDDAAVGTAVVASIPPAAPSKRVESKQKDQSCILMPVNSRGIPSIAYYAGFAWAKAGVITTEQQWTDYLVNFKTRLNQPVSVEYVK